MEERPGVWLLFGYEACAALIRAPSLSAVRPPSVLVAVTGAALQEFDDLVRHMQRWLLLRDAPRHSELRKLLNPAFTPLIAERLRHKIDAIIDRLLDDVRGLDTVDLIKDFAYPLPVRVICTAEDLNAQCVMLLFAGHETTRNLIGNGLYTLLKHPDACNELRHDETLWQSAIEELLRYESPVQATGRTLKTDMEIDGTRLPAGSSIMFMIGAAHRDPRQYSNPDQLDIRRSRNRHLAFGGDAHVCLGSTLARLEGRLSMGAVMRRFPNLKLVDQQADWGSNFAFRGLNTLRVRV